MNPKKKLNLMIAVLLFMGPATLLLPLFLSWIFPKHFPSPFIDFMVGGVALGGMSMLFYALSWSFKGTEEYRQQERILSKYPLLAFLMAFIVWFGGAMFSDWTW